MLLQSFAVVAPLFALIALGYGGVKSRLVSARAGSGLSEFVFVFAIPALLFRTVATAELPNVDPFGYWIAYFSALACCWLIAMVLARRMGRDAQEAAVIGFSAAQSNTVLIGLPLILALFGEAGQAPIVLLLMVHLPVTMTIVTLLIAHGDKGGNNGLSLLKALVSHPILLAIFAGLLWRQTHLPLPYLARSVLKFLGDAAAPCALVSLGMSMDGISLKGSRTMIGIVSVLKLIVHPVLVWFLATKMFHLPPVWVGSAVLFAACPTGINAYLVANRYKSGEAIASGSIALSTLAAIITMTIAVAVVMGLKG